MEIKSPASESKREEKIDNEMEAIFPSKSSGKSSG